MRTGKTVKAKQKQRETDLSKYTDKKDVDHDLQNNLFWQKRLSQKFILEMLR